VLIVIDQLEKLFTQATVAERDAFLAGLRALRGEHRCAVIVTLRTDFFGALMENQLWPERGHDQLSLVNVGVAVEPELIERLLADAASEPGILPLLQETMIHERGRVVPRRGDSERACTLPSQSSLNRHRLKHRQGVRAHSDE
jgi:hypothetical protein